MVVARKDHILAGFLTRPNERQGAATVRHGPESPEGPEQRRIGVYVRIAAVERVPSGASSRQLFGQTPDHARLRAP
jgi:hypothetical protein